MPLDDQALAGLIMWIPGGIAYVAAALVLLNRLLRDEPLREEPLREEPLRAPAPASTRVLQFPAVAHAADAGVKA
jgi:hypothetical protein